MNADDRIDAALRAVAQVEASRGFQGEVRARLEAGDGASVLWWPRLVAASVMAVLVASVVWVSRDTPAPSPMVVATPSQTPVPSPTAAMEVATDTASPPAVEPRRVSTTRMATSDHERALPRLASLDPLDLPSVAPEAMVVMNREIAPLAPIAPLPVHDMFGDDRGEP